MLRLEFNIFVSVEKKFYDGSCEFEQIMDGSYLVVS